MPINDEASKSLKNEPTSGSTATETRGAESGESQGAPVSEIEKKLMSAAEELGTWLGTAERKTIEFIAQQPKITDQLTRIRDTASRLLAQIEKGREAGQKK
jgi:hypothetical protein